MLFHLMTDLLFVC